MPTLLATAAVTLLRMPLLRTTQPGAWMEAHHATATHQSPGATAAASGATVATPPTPATASGSPGPSGGRSRTPLLFDSPTF